MTPSEIEEHGDEEQSGDTEEKDDTLESDYTEEEDGSSESALEAFVKKGMKDLIEGERALKRAMLKKREKELAEGERALQNATLRLEKEKSKVYGNAAPSDVLHLNVGGTKMAVLRSTLTSVSGSMLASKFSGRWDDSIPRDREGNFFIDQRFSVFELMVNHLRAKACQAPNAPSLEPPHFTNVSNYINRYGEKDYHRSTASVATPSSVTELEFLRMVLHYEMVLGIYAAKLSLLSRNPSSVEFTDDLSVNASDWATFGIAAEGHHFTITSFEVTILKVERAHIGWRESNSIKCFSDLDSTIGVGDIDGTVALDCCRSIILLNGALIPIDGTCKEGSTIRCEDRGNKWYIDGRLVASTDQSDNATSIDDIMTNWYYTALPAISVDGSFYVSKVEYSEFSTEWER
jgi:hypothetical protein